MIDEATTVPIGWLIGLGALALTGIFFWLRSEFSRLDGQHSELKESVVSVHKRVDWLIVKLLPGHPYTEKDDG